MVGGSVAGHALFAAGVRIRFGKTRSNWRCEPLWKERESRRWAGLRRGAKSAGTRCHEHEDVLHGIRPSISGLLLRGVSGPAFSDLHFLSGCHMAHVTPRAFRRRLECLGWRALAGGQRADSRWWQMAASCGHTIVAIANTETQAWAAAWSLALKLTRAGHVTER